MPSSPHHGVSDPSGSPAEPARIDAGAITLDAAGRVTFWSEAAAALLGRPAADMQGQGVEALLDVGWLDEARARGTMAAMRVLARPDGTMVSLTAELSVLRGAAGEVAGFLLLLQSPDGAARLRESEDHFRHTVELNPQVPWTCDPEGRVTSYSTRWLELTGQAPGEPDGSGWLAALHPADVAHTVERFDIGLRSGAPVDVDYRIRVAASGAYRWMRARAQPRRDAEGRIIRWYGVVEDIHDRKLAEVALRASEQRYRLLFEAIDAGFCVMEMVWDEAGRPVDYRFIEINPAFERQAGFLPLPGQRMRDIAPTHDQHWFDTYGHVSMTGETANVENSSDPLDRWWHVHAFRIGDEPGGHVGALFTDVTRRRRGEIALAQSQERFRVFAQAVPNHIWAATAAGALDWVNDQARLYAGVGADDPLDGAWERWVHPEDFAAMRRRWEAARRSGRFFEAELRLRRADGMFRWHLVRAIAVRDADGHVARWVGASTDIHDQKEAAGALGNMNDTLELLVAERTRERDRVWNSTNELMGTAGLDGTLRQVNPAWTRMLGYEEAELRRRPFWTLLDPEDHGMAEGVMRRLAAGEPVRGAVTRLLPKEGPRRVVMWDLVPDGDVFHVAGRDMTELHRVEEQLRQSQKMEAVGQLTGGLAHDFNNLLTGITGSLHLLQRRIAQGRVDEADRYVEAAQGAATRAAALTHRLLAFSRRQTLDPRATDVNLLVAGLEELIRRTVGPEIAVAVTSSPDAWITLVDPGQLENALLNLCINARDAMPDGGTLRIVIEAHEFDAGAAAERGVPAGHYVALCVTDDGSGMPADVVARAFDPFFTTKPTGKGTGLGLSMVYGFARQSGGQVSIRSAPGHGTTVTIHLPRHLGDAAEAAGPAPAVAARVPGDETVLVVDDERAVRMLVGEVLVELGYRVIEAADGPSALKVLESGQALDLLVTDVGLPGGLNGRQVADAARVRRPGLKILFITGYAESAVLNPDALGPGMHVLTKPFELDVLAARIGDLLAAE